MAHDNCVEKCMAVEQGRSDYGAENVDLVRIRDVLGLALQTDLFLCMMSQHSPSYVVQGLPHLFEEAWGWLEGNHGVYRSLGQLPWDDYCVVNAEKVLELMQVIHGSMTEDDTKPLFVYNGANKSLLSVEALEVGKRKKGLEQEVDAVKQQKALSTTAESKDNQEPNENEKESEQLTFYTRNAFSDARVLSSSSIKINYLVNQICRYHTTEKCIIFSQHYNEMYEIYLALQLAKVRVLMYQDNRMVCVVV
jgi:hypothetical protein